jgi:hypothetical protein
VAGNNPSGNPLDATRSVARRRSRSGGQRQKKQITRATDLLTLQVSNYLRLSLEEKLSLDQWYCRVFQ